ncbi:MAG TPA: 5'/3'-nucleotidase SurE [Nitrososphaeria archaeon]|nr:5'/3'-nucleotidase SurE [Nitrososphaeria archaeon]
MNNEEHLPLVLVSNDDGPESPGLRALLEALNDGRVEVTFIVPEGPRSSSGMSLTFHKPLRAWEREISGVRGYVVSGSPADCVMLGRLRLLDRTPCAVASGINIGDNTGLQDIYASGTVAAALQAALLGIPSSAFSMMVERDGIMAGEREMLEGFAEASRYAAEATRWICEHGLPEGVHLLNVNFPLRIAAPATVELTRPVRRKYENNVVERMDPRGFPYYWVWGRRLGGYSEGTDAWAVYTRGAVSVTPLNIDLASPSSSGMDDLRARLESVGRAKD